MEEYQVKDLLLKYTHDFFGKVGASETIDMLEYNSIKKIAVIRIPKKTYTQFRCIIALIFEYNNKPCSVSILKGSPFLHSLANSNRFLELNNFEEVL